MNEGASGGRSVPDLLRATLIENGVSESQIEVIPDEAAAVEAALNMSKIDDLLLIFGDNIARTWKQIIYFNRPKELAVEDTDPPTATPQSGVFSDSAADPLAHATPVEDAPDIPENMLLGGLRMVRDSRGVRLEDLGDEDGD